MLALSCACHFHLPQKEGNIEQNIFFSKSTSYKKRSQHKGEISTLWLILLSFTGLPLLYGVKLVFRVHVRVAEGGGVAQASPSRRLSTPTNLWMVTSRKLINAARECQIGTSLKTWRKKAASWRKCNLQTKQTRTFFTHSGTHDRIFKKALLISFCPQKS